MSQGFLSVSPEEEINQWGEHQKQDTYNTRATCRNPACPLFLLSRLGFGRRVQGHVRTSAVPSPWMAFFRLGYHKETPGSDGVPRQARQRHCLSLACSRLRPLRWRCRSRIQYLKQGQRKKAEEHGSFMLSYLNLSAP